MFPSRNRLISEFLKLNCDVYNDKNMGNWTELIKSALFIEEFINNEIYIIDIIYFKKIKNDECMFPSRNWLISEFLKLNCDVYNDKYMGNWTELIKSQ